MTAMAIQLLYFARLREIFGSDGETLHLPSGDIVVADIIAHLHKRGGKWQLELASGKALAFAVNQQLAGLQTAVPPDAEVAIFPPITGG